MLGIVPSFSGDTYSIVVNTQHKGPVFAEELHGTVDFGHDKIRTWLLHYGGKGVNLSDYQVRVSADEIEQARSAATVELRSEKGDDYEFALSEMPTLLDALRACTADLQQYWRPTHPANPISTSARGDLRGIFTGGDYPSEAFMRGQGGTAQFQLLIDETGRVAGCDVVRQSGIPILDVMGCQVITERARFTPAREASGKPVRDVVTTPPIRWQMSG